MNALSNFRSYRRPPTLGYKHSEVITGLGGRHCAFRRSTLDLKEMRLMPLRSNYLTASAVLALVLAAPAMVAAQPTPNGGQNQVERRPGQGGEAASRPSRPRPQGASQRPHGSSEAGTPARGGGPTAGNKAQSGTAHTEGQRQENVPAKLPERAVQQRLSQPPPVRAQRNAPPQRAATAAQAPPLPSARPANVQRLRRNVQAPRRFRAGTYQAPRGYTQQRWSYGERLPASYYARNFWISNYLLYALFTPPSGLVWVRVGHDAFLIDRYDGEIIQVRYNVFY